LKKAIWTFLTETCGGEPESTSEARKRLKETMNFKESLNFFPEKLRWERAIINHLIRNPGDFAGAFRKIPKKLRKIFVHAYQSYVWNRVALLAKKEKTIPVVGCDTNLNGKVGNLIKDILKEDGIEPSNFSIKTMPEMISRGCERNVRIYPHIAWKIGEDEINKSKLKVILEFELPKGSYATTVIEAMGFDKSNNSDLQ
jgi:tRNA pseudouridine13 synthase